VVRDGDDLYAVPDAVAGEADPTQAGPAPGSGKPDETNGVCRLFAPKLPKPECCAAETGFDVETAKSACGHSIYLGESFQHSCGYYFHRDQGKPAWFRVAFVPGDNPKDAANSHDARMKRLTKNPQFESTPVPGVRGAYRSGHDGLNWAFLPGWPQVRLLSWRDTSCDDAGIKKLMAKIIGAKKPPKGARRPGLFPKARE
jgi:hypothetical protein